MSVYHRTYAEIDLQAIGKNFDALKALLPQGVKAAATVKADAYGHGSLAVAAFLEDRVDYFSVACVSEGAELRAGGIQKPILVLGYTDPQEYAALLENTLTATLYSLPEARLLSQKALSLGKEARVHLKVDTGMGRLGLPASEEGAELAAKIAALDGIFLEGVFSHFACADEADKTSALDQVRLFDAFLLSLKERGVEPHIRHLCNSAGTIEEVFPKYDMCRFGISLYGIYPSDEVDQSRVKLYPAMAVRSHIAHVKKVPEGTGVSYGQLYKAPSERLLATVTVGYADGYPRCMTGVGRILVKGGRCPVVGRVCMDQIIVDVSEVPDVRVGDEVTLLGRDGKEEIGADEFGSLCHSFSYEVLCGFMPRVKRVYKK